jgi:hypothetical protein
MTTMPKLPVETMVAGCDDNEARIVRAAFNGRTGCLRASKPFGRIEKTDSDEEALFKASVNYVWRMLCFDYVGWGKHSCMPVTADWDIGAVYVRIFERDGRTARFGSPEYDSPADRAAREERRGKERDLREALDALIKRVESTLPVTAQAGAMRWGRALGMIS